MLKKSTPLPAKAVEPLGMLTCKLKYYKKIEKIVRANLEKIQKFHKKFVPTSFSNLKITSKLYIGYSSLNQPLRRFSLSFGVRLFMCVGVCLPPHGDFLHTLTNYIRDGFN